MISKKIKRKKRALETIAAINMDGKKAGQLIAFRADFESLKRVESLENLTGKNKTDLIKEAIKDAFNGLLLKETLEILLKQIKKEFKGAKVKHSGGFDFLRDLEKEDSSIDFSYNTGVVIISLPEFKVKCKNKDLKSSLRILILELKVEGLKTIKLELIKPIIFGNLNKVKASLLKEIQKVAFKNKLELKSAPSSIRKDHINFEFRLERGLFLHNKKWVDYLKEDFKLLHNALNQLKKLDCFKKVAEKND